MGYTCFSKFYVSFRDNIGITRLLVDLQHDGSRKTLSGNTGNGAGKLVTAPGIGMIEPLVSIVIPLYNKEKEVSRSLKSALSQTIADVEVIVVDDGSTDRGPDIVKDWQDVRIRLVRQKNAGVSTARNRGIAEARTELIAFLDADDEWHPTFIETVLHLRERFPECGVYATSYVHHQPGENDRTAIIRGLADESGEVILRDYFRIAAQSDPPFCSSSVAVKKSAIVAIGGFPIGVTIGEDLLTWARLAVYYEIAYFRSPQAVIWSPLPSEYRQHRPLQSPDRVAIDLIKLLTEVRTEHTESLRQYISLWHRMRAVVYLQFNLTAESRRELAYSVEYAGFSLRLLILMLLSYFPGTLPARLQYFMNTAFRKIRSFGE